MESKELLCHRCAATVRARDTHCTFEEQLWCVACALDEFQIGIGHEASIKRFLVQAVTLFSMWIAVLVGWAFTSTRVTVGIAIFATWMSHRVLSEGRSIPAGVQVIEDGQPLDSDSAGSFPVFLSFMLLFRNRRFTMAVILGLLAVLIASWWGARG